MVADGVERGGLAQVLVGEGGPTRCPPDERPGSWTGDIELALVRFHARLLPAQAQLQKSRHEAVYVVLLTCAAPRASDLSPGRSRMGISLLMLQRGSCCSAPAVPKGVAF